MHVDKMLEMASDMLLLVADEVARNGAFGKILRPEVFTNAPLRLRLSLRLWIKVDAARFAGFPPRGPPLIPGSGRSAILTPHLPPEGLKRQPVAPARRCRPHAAT